MRQTTFILTLITALLIGSEYCLGADSTSTGSEDLFYWANVGLGFGDWQNHATGILSGSISANRGNEMVTLSFVHNTEVELHIFGPNPPDNYIWALGALYGRVTKSSSGFASISAGIAVTYMSIFTESISNPYPGTGTYTTDGSFGFGIPVEAQAFWTPAGFMGIGLIATGNLGFGAGRSFAGLILSLRFGVLK